MITDQASWDLSKYVELPFMKVQKHIVNYEIEWFRTSPLDAALYGIPFFMKVIWGADDKSRHFVCGGCNQISEIIFGALFLSNLHVLHYCCDSCYVMGMAQYSEKVFKAEQQTPPLNIKDINLNMVYDDTGIKYGI